MIEVMVDADLILEAFINRESFVSDPEEAFELLQSHGIQGYILELGLEKIRLIISTLASDRIAEEFISVIGESIKVCPVNTSLIQQARSFNIIDFESALEVTYAIHNKFGAILTHCTEMFEGEIFPKLTVNDLLQRKKLDRLLQKVVIPVVSMGSLVELDYIKTKDRSNRWSSLDYQENNILSITPESFEDKDGQDIIIDVECYINLSKGKGNLVVDKGEVNIILNECKGNIIFNRLQGNIVLNKCKGNVMFNDCKVRLINNQYKGNIMFNNCDVSLANNSSKSLIMFNKCDINFIENKSKGDTHYSSVK